MKKLANKKILITRPRDQAEEFKQLLVEYDAIPIVTPLIRIEVLHFDLPDLDLFDSIIFTSQNAVKIFFDRNPKLQKNMKIAAVGEKTDEQLEKYGWKA